MHMISIKINVKFTLLLTHCNYLELNSAVITLCLNKASCHPEYCTTCNIALFLCALPKL